MATAERAKSHTIHDIYALPDGIRAELIDGQIYYMAPPGRTHQKISGLLHAEIHNYIRRNHGTCEAYAAPFAVFLNKDEVNYVEPDISVICDLSKLDERGCHGAPDWVIEIISPSNPQMDYGIKLFKYRTAGVREYWIVNPQKKAVLVFDFEKNQHSNQYDFHDNIPVCIYEGFTMNIDSLQSFPKK